MKIEIRKKSHISRSSTKTLFSLVFLKPGLTKTIYLMKDFQFLLDGAACFMLENFKKKHTANKFAVLDRENEIAKHLRMAIQNVF